MPTADDTPLGRHAATPAELQERLLAERRGDPFLVYRRDAGGQQLVPLHPGLERVTIGRGPSNDVALGWDTEVSRVHAELERLGGDWTLVDDGLCRNGTWSTARASPAASGCATATSSRSARRSSPSASPTRRTRARRRRRRPRRRAAAHARRSAASSRRSAAPTRSPSSRPPRPTRPSPRSCSSRVDAVKAHLRALFATFGIQDLPQNQKRSTLAMRALQLGIVK